MKTAIVKIIGVENTRFLTHLKDRLFYLTAVVLSSVLRILLPYRVTVYLQSKLQVIRKMDYGKTPLYLHINSKHEYGMRLHSSAREADTVDWMETNIRKGDVIYDIGANVGSYALIAAVQGEGEVQVYAFEPSFPNFYQLCRNVGLNKLQERIFPMNIAVSGKSGTDFFNYASLLSGSAIHTFGEPIDAYGHRFTPTLRQLMLSFTIDDMVDRFHFPVPNHIKIDVDGIEEEILHGAKKTLENPKVKSVLVEVNEADDETEIRKFMEERGFYYDSFGKVEHCKVGNFIFKRKSD